jgi:hypothetical protein
MLKVHRPTLAALRRNTGAARTERNAVPKKPNGFLAM